MLLEQGNLTSLLCWICTDRKRQQRTLCLSNMLDRDSGKLGKREEKEAQLEGHMAERYKPKPLPAQCNI